MSPEMILLADISGYIIVNEGTISGLDLNSVVTLVAGGFAAANELDNLIEQNRASSQETPSPVDENTSPTKKVEAMTTMPPI